MTKKKKLAPQKKAPSAPRKMAIAPEPPAPKKASREDLEERVKYLEGQLAFHKRQANVA